MAKKTIFQTIDMHKYAALGCDATCTTFYGVPVDTNGHNIQTILATTSFSCYEEIKGTLEDETTDDLSTVKKAFIMPGVAMSADRLKVALREHKVVVTNDYELADVLINDGLCADEHDSTFRTTKPLHHKTNMYILKEGFAEDYYNQTGNWTIYCDKVKNSQPLYNVDYESAEYDLYGISGLAIELATKIKAGDMQVVDVETVMNSSNTKQRLTPELLDQLTAMLNSSEDRELAGTILPTIDYRYEPGLMWKLAGECYQRIDYDFNRSKDIRYWAEKARIRKLSRLSAQDAILYFEETGELDAKTFKMLEPIVRSEISIHNRDLYVFTVQIKPEYRKYFKKKKDEIKS